MFKKFIGRSLRLAVKQLAGGAARIYIKNSQALSAAGFVAGSKINIKYRTNGISITLDRQGGNSVINTGRGELVELKNRATADAVNGASHVTVTFRVGHIDIVIHKFLAAMRQREQQLISSLKQGHRLRTASFFSGLGMLTYHIKQGLAAAGVMTGIAFANDYSELAMSLNAEHNPIWADATDDAHISVDDLYEMDISTLPKVDIVDIGYPCVGFSSLAIAQNKDTLHPLCGALFIPLAAAIRQMNPAIILMENVPRFQTSDTLRLLKQAFFDYTFVEQQLDGQTFGEIESRKRVCVVGVSKGLSSFEFPSLPAAKPAPALSTYLQDIPLDDACWRAMEHVRRKDLELSHNYKNCLYQGHEQKIAALTASYANPKAGTPMIAHPENESLQRQITVFEHALIRALPQELLNGVMTVVNGSHPLVNSQGSVSAGHRLLGNGVSSEIWRWVGGALGQWLFGLLPARQLNAA